MAGIATKGRLTHVETFEATANIDFLSLFLYA